MKDNIEFEYNNKKHIIVEKCALREKEIEEKNKRNVKYIEVQLLSCKDNLSLIDNFNAQIVSVHLPFEICEISKINRIINEDNKEYDFLCRLCGICCAKKIDLVIHADVTLSQLLKNKEIFKKTIDFMKKAGVCWHIENVCGQINNGQKCISAPIEICNYINGFVINPIAFPLLDICHFLMMREKMYEPIYDSLETTLFKYHSTNFFIHLCDKLGSGDELTGGIHGNNFRYNKPLLSDIINSLSNTKCHLVLEIHEDDYIKTKNVKELEKYINEIENDINFS